MLNIIISYYYNMESFDLVIIGGGISGLYCAYHLQKQFPKILIIEKDDRIGGRIFTQKIVANNKHSYIELGANRFSIHHTKVMKLIDDLKLSNFLIKDIDEMSSQYISSKSFDYDNNVNIRELMKIVIDVGKHLKKHKLMEISFAQLCQNIFDRPNYLLFKKLLIENIKNNRVNYAGGLSKERFHPSYKGLFCDVEETLRKINKKDTYRTPYFVDYIHVFEQSAFIGMRMIYTLFFNKKINLYYRLANGNISICDRLYELFLQRGGTIYYNCDFIDFKYSNSNKEFDIIYNNGDRTINIFSKLLIVTIPTNYLKKIPSFSHLQPYLQHCNSTVLGFIYAVYPKNPKTNKVWFHDIPWIITDNELSQVWSADKKNGVLMVSYMFGSKIVDKYERLFKKSIDKLYAVLEKNLMILFPSINIPKPTNLYFKAWKDGGTNAFYADTDYCDIYKKILFPIKNVPVFICNEAYSYRGGWIEGSLEVADEVINKIVLDNINDR